MENDWDLVQVLLYLSYNYQNQLKKTDKTEDKL